MKALIVADSVYNDQRLVTILTVAPKFLDAEIEKHRMISSSSSSDRAVPSSRLLNQDVFFPTDIRLNEPGMQGLQRLEDEEKEEFISELGDMYAKICGFVAKWGFVHKQHLNRYLAPFTMQRKIMTATYDQWEYFLRLRNSEAADPAMQRLAQLIQLELKTGLSEVMSIGQWHLPFLSSREHEHPRARDISAARCARVSYLNHDGTDANIAKDLELADMLRSHKHATPFEHQATPMSEADSRYTHIDRSGNYWSGNFKGWVQYRQLIMPWGE